MAAAQGIGAALSNAIAGPIVVGVGYDAAFVALAGTAALGLVAWLTAIPETPVDAIAVRT